jgi:phage terminase large subunit-like protein
MIPASAALHEAVVKGRIHHPNDARLNEHVAAAVAKHGRRGWRIDQAERGGNIDGLVALVMAHEARTAPAPPETKVLGWL